MKILPTLGVLAAAGIALTPFGAQAFDCPNRFAAAQTAIDKVMADMKGMEGEMSKGDMALVHALLDDAKMMLTGGKHNHAKPRGAYDHARAVAKADAALGHAQAAGFLHASMMKK